MAILRWSQERQSGAIHDRTRPPVFLNAFQRGDIRIIRCARRKRADVAEVLAAATAIKCFRGYRKQPRLADTAADDQFDRTVTMVEKFNRKAAPEPRLNHCVQSHV